MSDMKTDTTTTIGSDAVFKGELTFENNMKIDGKFEGQLKSKGKLLVGKGATLSGEIQIGGVVIEGQLKGNVVGSERVELASSSQVLGDIRAPKLVVSEGATFVGNVNVSPDALKGGSVQTPVVNRETVPQPQKK